jgi:hypothetical protein
MGGIPSCTIVSMIFLSAPRKTGAVLAGNNEPGDCLKTTYMTPKPGCIPSTHGKRPCYALALWHGAAEVRNGGLQLDNLFKPRCPFLLRL